MQKQLLYPWSTDNAKLGNIIVVKSTYRNYGYSLKDLASGQVATWYRYKRDALKRIEQLKQ